LANVGSEPNSRLIPEGINHKLAEKEFEKQGIMMVMARQNVPVLHVRRIQRWARKYEVASTQEKIPTPGEGPAFSSRKHNVTMIHLSGLLVAAMVVVKSSTDMIAVLWPTSSIPMRSCNRCSESRTHAQIFSIQTPIFSME
jgi:hypothetical protein